MKCLLVLIFLEATIICAGKQPVRFADPNLKVAVERELRTSDPAPADMLRLTHLCASGKKIRRLSGLKYARNLRHLELPHNMIDNISELAGLGHLQTLSLYGNQLSEIFCLSELKNLQKLNLAGNRISDISALAEAEQLTWLDLSFNGRLENIGTLSELKRLTTLYLAGNSIREISALSKLKNLQTLQLDQNQIEDVSDLTHLPGLVSLHLSNNRIKDISALADFRNLSVLTLRGNPLNSAAYKVYLALIARNNPKLVRQSKDWELRWRLRFLPEIHHNNLDKFATLTYDPRPRFRLAACVVLCCVGFTISLCAAIFIRSRCKTKASKANPDRGPANHQVF